jgi:hypothetical protein
VIRRAVAIGGLLLGCGAHHAASDGWPRSAGTPAAQAGSDDGGQSLAPQVSTTVAAIEAKDDDAPAPVIADKPAVVVDKPAATADKPTAEPPAGDDVTLTTEDIVIEVKD